IDEKKSLEEKLEQSRQELVAYTKKLGTISTISSETNIVASQMVELNTRLGAARAERIKLETDNSLTEKYRDDPEALLQVSSIAQMPEIANLRAQLNTLDAELSKTRQKYKGK